MDRPKGFGGGMSVGGGGRRSTLGQQPTVTPLGAGLSRSKSFTLLNGAGGSVTPSVVMRRVLDRNGTPGSSTSLLNRSAPAPSGSTLSAKTANKLKRSSWFGSSGLDSTTPLEHSASTWTLNVQNGPSGKKKEKSAGTSVSGSPASKEPRPQRSLQAAETVLQGLKAAVLMTENDLEALKSGRNQTVKDPDEEEAAHAYLERLDDRLAEVEQIREEYAVQDRLREGVRAIGRAYIGSLGPERDSALTNVKSGFKECNETMCALEGRLESMLGALHVQMKGLQGFARLCAGDVFEISLRHGQRKWRTRGKIGRDGSSQTWDSTTATFPLSLDQMIFIRAVEIRSLGKQILLGNKFCEPLDLLSAHPQMMTVSLTSSLKLNLVVTWDPLHGSSLSASSAVTPSSTVRSIATAGRTMTSKSSGSISGGSSLGASPDLEVLGRNPNSARLQKLFGQMDFQEEEEEEEDEIPEPPRDPSPDYNHHSSRDSLNETGRKSAEPAKTDESGNFLLVRRMNRERRPEASGWYYSSPTHTVDSGYEDSASSGSKKQRKVLSQVFTEEAAEAAKSRPDEEPDWSLSAGTLDWVVGKLRGAIATDLQGQYAELELFESSVAALHRLVRLQTDPQPSPTDVSDALEAFDFLDSEESLPHEETGGQQPAVLFTKQLDETLLIHLKYSRRLTKDLGHYGPLKARERAALAKLPVQGRILAKLAKLIEKWQANPAVKLSIHEELRGLPHLQKLWGIVCGEDRSLSVGCQEAFARLLPLARECLPDSSGDSQERALKALIARCQDVPGFRPSGRLTVFQFRYFVRSKERSFATRLEEIADEQALLDALDSKNPSIIKRALARLIRRPDEQHNLNAILVKMSHLLIDPEGDEDLRSVVRSFLEDRDWAGKLLDAFVEGLESLDPADREGSCQALGLLGDPSVVHQLAYVAQSDPCAQVRKRAKSSLESMGPQGRQALHDIQLSSHGFQGVSVK